MTTTWNHCQAQVSDFSGFRFFAHGARARFTYTRRNGSTVHLCGTHKNAFERRGFVRLETGTPMDTLRSEDLAPAEGATA